ncbi:MAG: alanine--tRNA ligase [Ruminococcus sp.]|jgi:alanyl-tRNA synthetase|nr:alanine--tRNA ligase [Ruminococcus sp.]
MQYTGLNELREKFLSFFESKGHIRKKSASLVPIGDKSLLLINSGMAPLKKFFLGTETPPGKRMTTCQKCIRTPDIERVGKTSRHGTYFEMLGNFSFGDYFKIDAIKWAWEFFTEVLEIPKDLLYCSVYLEDDEAYEIWTKTVGVPETHMMKLGKEDNFWEHGSGPCGPCSEIYIYRGKGDAPTDLNEAMENDELIEVWNLVFSQFDSDGAGTYTEMETKNIDTGMGLERLACVIQGVDNLFEVDTVKNIMAHISKISGTEYRKSENNDVSLRVITDHIRSTVFMVGDGVIPSNEGRGYVLRRLLRRASRHGRLLGVKKSFLYEVAETVIKENENAYPELREKDEYIKKIIKVEEENFAKTIDKGLELLNEEIKELKGNLSGDVAFKLSDTFGFPIDLTIELCSERGIEVELDRYNELVKRQRETAKADYKAKGGSSWEEQELKFELPETEFTGYDMLETDSKVMYVDDNVILLDKTPFYAESGGQVGDTGVIGGLKIADTKKDSNGHILHILSKDGEETNLTEPSVKVGDIVKAKVDKTKRMCTMKNHTSAHILQAVLRQVLGDHVHQAGQLVGPNECRFDFNHFSAVTESELSEIETKVNEIIDEAVAVETQVMTMDEAKNTGAMALFGEKYGEKVRVVTVGDNKSKEFCGGTHVPNTAFIGAFKILSENSVAAGTRRISAVTGTGILTELEKYKSILADERIRYQTERKLINKEVEKLGHELATQRAESLLSCEKDGIIVKYIAGQNNDSLRLLCDGLKDKGMLAVLYSDKAFACTERKFMKEIAGIFKSGGKDKEFFECLTSLKSK